MNEKMLNNNKETDSLFDNTGFIHDESMQVFGNLALSEEAMEDMDEMEDEVDSLEDSYDDINIGDMDSFNYYLKMIGEFPLFTEDEEREVAVRLKNGREAKEELDSLTEMLNDPETDKKTADFLNQEIKEKEKIYLDGKKAKDELVTHNLRLVVSIAKRYASLSMTIEDLIQEGCIGLMRATETYDYTKGFRFTTYATCWIKQAISRGLALRDRAIRLPVHVIEEIFRVKKVKRELALKLGREPEINELSDATGVEVNRIEELLLCNTEPTYLSTPVGETGDTTIEDFVTDDNAVDPQDAAADTMLTRAINEAMDKYLNPREKEILVRRFGLFGRERESLEHIGNDYGITRERVRQLEGIAIKKLKNRKKLEELHDYLYA